MLAEGVSVLPMLCGIWSLLALGEYTGDSPDGGCFSPFTNEGVLHADTDSCFHVPPTGLHEIFGLCCAWTEEPSKADTMPRFVGVPL